MYQLIPSVITIPDDVLTDGNSPPPVLSRLEHRPVSRVAPSVTVDIPCITLWDSDDELSDQSSSGMRGGRERLQESHNDESNDSSTTVLRNLQDSPTVKENPFDGDEV